MPTDTLRQLQAVAWEMVCEHAPGVIPENVQITAAGGRVLFSFPVAPAAPRPAGQAATLAPAVRPGWDVTEERALFDGERVKVAASRLKLLRVLAGAESPMTAKELTSAVFDNVTDIQNTRYHVRLLKKELGEVFPSFEGDLIVGDDEGYRLVLR